VRLRSECDAIYRLLVPPPVTVRWRCCTQTLRVRRNPYPPFGVIELITDGGRTWADNFKSGLHAEHVLANGWRVPAPGVFDTFMARLVRNGSAEIVAGPHCAYLNQKMTSEQFSRLRELDARYTYRGPDGEIDALI